MHLTSRSCPKLCQHHVSYTLALLVMHALLMHAQGLPWRPTSVEAANDGESWETTVRGTLAMCDMLSAIQASVTQRHTAMLPADGSWAAAVQRVRCNPAISGFAIPVCSALQHSLIASRFITGAAVPAMTLCCALQGPESATLDGSGIGGAAREDTADICQAARQRHEQRNTDRQLFSG